jgi:hypothetical protein
MLSFTAPAAVVTVHWAPDGNHVITDGYFNTPVVRRAWQPTEALITHARECCATREPAS